uniref:Uncharacterized protein n=1 Tax=Odontella aurita TaxID=265563 RepID=A0A7S4HJ79_9STRA|mmetsp:Transcript_10827/g.32056  ORF Transcript_10827/g.32056 Transcript_10827/m.32056 type:complete len:197 (+) Transcript_10827:276-866(+)|eukprot:CAMPEP_0113546580 /NCGR_PEP_ID=MMETSP0015_2-20120614/11881_1 /TAXON_ID=2838 /ORGANISM="Odontella" /LENGTH=196 /DNA_ID=CAMNT_0000447043 /DNA_START=208 /DNA_END=798 /DNA_ORIENTATION=+ /assembly_acc=CAM_ASM_000160
MTRKTSVLFFVAAALVVLPAESAIGLGSPSKCSGTNYDMYLDSVTCSNCDFGQEATLTGTIKGTCPQDGDEVTVVVTASAALGTQRLFEKKSDCDSSGITFSEKYNIPNIDTPNIPAMGTITVEMSSGGEIIGCDTVSATTTTMRAVQAAGATLAVGAVAAAGVAAWSKFVAGGAAAGAAATAGSNFQKMDENGVV